MRVVQTAGRLEPRAERAALPLVQRRALTVVGLQALTLRARRRRVPAV